jgi:hypothetical protein
MMCEYRLRRGLPRFGKYSVSAGVVQWRTFSNGGKHTSNPRKSGLSVLKNPLEFDSFADRMDGFALLKTTQTFSG